MHKQEKRYCSYEQAPVHLCMVILAAACTTRSSSGTLWTEGGRISASMVLKGKRHRELCRL
jgi:hypothetical protein